MKRVMTFLFVALSVATYSQKNTDSTKLKQDSLITKKDSTKINYYIGVFSKDELDNLVGLMREADEKPSVISYWVNLFTSKLQKAEVNNPAQEVGKTQKPKK